VLRGLRNRRATLGIFKLLAQTNAAFWLRSRNRRTALTRAFIASQRPSFADVFAVDFPFFDGLPPRFTDADISGAKRVSGVNSTIDAKVSVRCGEVEHMTAKRPPADTENAIKTYLAGNSIRATAKLTGLTPGFVADAVERAGVSRGFSGGRAQFFANGGKANRYIDGLPVAEIAAAYRSGVTLCDLATKYSVDRNAIKTRLHKAGVRVRDYAETRRLIDREQALTNLAESRPNRIGWGEDIVKQWLIERGEEPDAQFPVGVKNLDLALAPVTVEIWLATRFPFNDPYCRERIEYLANRGWTSLYIYISRRTRVLLPCVVDEIIRIRDLTRRNPSAPRKHWVIRGCGELAAVAGDDLDHFSIIPPAVGCPHHSCVNKSVRR
jgi:hypothetical protein